MTLRMCQHTNLDSLAVRVAASTSSIKTFPAKQPEKIAEEPEKPGEKSTSEVTPLDHVSTKFYVGTEVQQYVHEHVLGMCLSTCFCTVCFPFTLLLLLLSLHSFVGLSCLFSMACFVITTH